MNLVLVEAVKSIKNAVVSRIYSGGGMGRSMFLCFFLKQFDPMFPSDASFLAIPGMIFC
jgi:hypothetical protein